MRSALALLLFASLTGCDAARVMLLGPPPRHLPSRMRPNTPCAQVLARALLDAPELQQALGTSAPQQMRCSPVGDIFDDVHDADHGIHHQQVRILGPGGELQAERIEWVGMGWSGVEWRVHYPSGARQYPPEKT